MEISTEVNIHNRALFKKQLQSKDNIADEVIPVVSLPSLPLPWDTCF